MRPFGRMLAVGIGALMILCAPAAAAPDEGYLGVYVSDLAPEKARQLKAPGDYGVLVMDVAEGSPAAQAGIKENDVIIEFNGIRVEGEVQFGRLVREMPPGRTIPVKIVREGKVHEVKVTLGSRRPITIGPDFQLTIPEIRIPPMIVQLGRYTRLGVRVQDLTEQLGEYFGVPGGRGVLITSVQPGSPAERAGLRAGDVIVAIEDREVNTVRDFRRALSTREGTISLTIVRNKERQKVSVTLERRERPYWEYRFREGETPDMCPFPFASPMYGCYLQRYVEELERHARELHSYAEELRRWAQQWEYQMREAPRRRAIPTL